MPVTIVPATPEDAAEVFRLIRELAIYEQRADEVRSSPDTIREAMEADDPRIHVLLAYNHDGGSDGAGPATVAAHERRSGEPAVGFALYYYAFSTFTGAPTLHLEDLFVEPAGRGKGIGTTLLRRLARVAIDHGCMRMEWTALDWNASARTFYENLGAVALPTWIIHRLDADGMDAVAGGSSTSPSGVSG